MPHPSTIGAENEVPGKAVFAPATCNRGGAKSGSTLAETNRRYVLAYFNDSACEFMAKNHGRIVAERVMPNMYIGSAHATVSNFKLYFVVAANGLSYVNDP